MQVYLVVHIDLAFNLHSYIYIFLVINDLLFKFYFLDLYNFVSERAQ